MPHHLCKSARLAAKTMPERYAAAAQPFCDGLLLWYRLQFTTAHATLGARCVGRLFHFLSFAPWTSSFNNLAGWSRFFLNLGNIWPSE